MEEEIFKSTVKLRRYEAHDEKLNVAITKKKIRIKIPKRILIRTKITDLASTGILTIQGGFHTPHIVFSTTEGYVKMFDNETNKLEWVNKTNIIPTYLNVTMNGKNVIFGSLTSDIFIVPFKGENKNVIYENTDKKIFIAKLLNDSDNLYIGGKKNLSKLYDVNKKMFYRNFTLDDNNETIYRCADRNKKIISNSNLIALGDNFGKTTIWDFSSYKAAFYYSSVVPHYITSIKFHPCGYVLVVAFSDRKIELIDLRSDVCFSSFIITPSSVPISIEFSLSGRLVFVGCSSGDVIIWDIILEKELQILKIFQNAPCSSVVVCDNGQKMFAASSKANVIYELKTK